LFLHHAHYQPKGKELSSEDQFIYFWSCIYYARSMVIRFTKILTIKSKIEIKENEKFTGSLDRTLALAYNSDTMKDNIYNHKRN
jgi:hypothetical protein